MARRAPWTEHPQVRSVRRRWGLADLVVEVLDGIRRHRTGRAVAVMSYYGFLSIFPLLLVFTTVLGFVLQGDDRMRQDVVDSVLTTFPVIGQQIEVDPAGLQGSGVALLAGLLITLWSGLKLFVATQLSMDDTWELELEDRTGYVRGRFRAAGALVVLGVVAILAASAAGVAAVPALGRLGTIVGFAVSALLNIVLLALVYRLLTSRALRFPEEILPGAVPSGVAFAAFQLVGTTVVARSIARASPVYGTFATVIALLFWLSLHAWAAMLGAEINAAISRRQRYSSASRT